MTHGSLFSGIGGFDLSAQWMGWTNVFQCEKDEWCRKVLGKNFPDVKRYSDIKEFNAKEYEGQIDVISGGFPCQPFSVAGKQLSKEDDRYLWPEMLRIIREIKPSFVVCENVPGIIKLALDTVLSDLENEGYTTETFIIPACAKNAWHRRDRIWIIAYAHGNGEMVQRRYGDRDNKKRDSKEKVQEQEDIFVGTDSTDYERISTNATSIGREQSGASRERRTGFENNNSDNGSITTNTNSERLEECGQSGTVSEEHITPRCDSWWETEPRMDRVVDGLPNRVDRIRGLGNSIVPQIAYEIFKAINIIYNDDNSKRT